MQRDNFLSDEFLGFIGNSELLPKGFDYFNNERKLRQLFLCLSNNILKKSITFSKYEQKRLSKYNLKTIFQYKIKMLMPSMVLVKKTSNTFNFCCESTKIINAYKNNKSYLTTSKPELLDIAKAILLCFTNNQFQLLLDKNQLFHEFVLKRVKRLHKNKIVKDLGDSISITGEDVSSLKLYTSWKEIATKNPNINMELQNAIKDIKKDGFLQVYLVYPKANSFKRHIPIYVDELKKDTYKIKVIPYSLRSTIK